MKTKTIGILCLLLCMMCLFGCGQKEVIHTCTKCGKSPASIISGPDWYMESQGISLGECHQITGNVYQAYLCDDCMGSVADGY